MTKEVIMSQYERELVMALSPVELERVLEIVDQQHCTIAQAVQQL